MPNRHDQERLDSLMAQLVDGGLGSSDASELQQLLESDEAAKVRYLNYIALDTSLGDAMGGETPLDVARSIGRVGARPAERSAPRWRSTMAVIAALVLLASGLRLFFFPQPTPTPTDGSARPAVAVLTRSAQASWEATGLSTAAGSALPAGTLKLKSGAVQIDFYSGAIVLLEGPAELELISVNKGFLRGGKIRAHVPPHAQGFTIATAGMDVVDLGTEYGLSIGSDGRKEVHVFNGKVELKGNGPVQELTTGQALAIAASGSVREIGADAGAFLSQAQLVDLSQESAHRRRQEWLAYNESLRTDSSMLLHYTFEGQEAWDNVVQNSADSGVGSSGAMIGATWSEGRWPGKKAVEFKRTSDRIRVNIPGSYPALTLAAWVRFDGLDNRLNALLTCDDRRLGGIHWQVVEHGRVRLTVNNDHLSAIRYHSGLGAISQAELGRWHHLAVVLDPTVERFVHYLDGRGLASDPPVRVGKDSAQSLPRVEIGRAEIGNWSAAGAIADPTERWHIRNLNGRLDEFIVFSRALSDEEVAELYEAGRP